MHQIDNNDFIFAKKKADIIGWIPDVRAVNGKINPQMTRLVTKDFSLIDVFHVKPIYYETLSGHWRPLCEVASHYGNHKIIFTFSGVSKVHPRYIHWLEKRMALIGGIIEVESPFSNEVKQLSPYVKYIHSFVFNPKIGLTVSTFYPDPSPETTTFDGYVYRDGVDLTWAAAHDTADGNGNSDSGSVLAITSREKSGASGYDIIRTIMLFDTSSISSDTVSAATLSLHDDNVVFTNIDNDGEDTVNIVSAAPASDTSIANGDYDSLGTTIYAPAFDFGNITLNAYNDFSFNSTGINAIDTSGVSKFGAREGHDLLDSSIGNNKQNNWQTHSADVSGTTQDPKLVVTHESAVSQNSNFLAFMQ